MEDMYCTLLVFCSRLKPDRLFGVPVSMSNEIIVVVALIVIIRNRKCWKPRFEGKHHGHGCQKTV